jgi:hypothetical protein
LLLVGSAAALDSRLDNIRTGWSLPGVATDLADVSMRDPFALLSMFVGGPAELESYGGTAAAQTDERMALEFSGPRAVNGAAAATITPTLRTKSRIEAPSGRE